MKQWINGLIKILFNDIVKRILQRCGYFGDTRTLARALKPIRISIQELENIHFIKIIINKRKKEAYSNCVKRGTNILSWYSIILHLLQVIFHNL